MLDEISKLIFVIVVALLIFMAGVQVGKKLKPTPQVRNVEAEEVKARIQIIIT